MVNNWTGTVLDIDEPSDTTLGFHGSNEMDRLNKLLDGVNLTTEESADVTINTDWYFYSNKLKFSDGLGHKINFLVPSSMTVDRNITLPDGSGTLAFANTVTANNWSNFLQQFDSGNFKLLDADESHGITFKTQGMTSNFDLTFPVPAHATDEEVIYSRRAGQVLYDKVLQNATFSAISIFMDSNTIKHSTTNNNSDIMIYRTSLGKYDRLQRGTAGQVLTVDPTGTFIQWTTPASGGAGTTGVTLLHKSFTALNIENTSSETNVFNVTVGAGVLGATDALRIVVYGSLMNDSGSDRQFTFKLKIAGVTVWSDDTGLVTDDGTIRRPYRMEFYIANRGVQTSQTIAGFYTLGRATVSDTAGVYSDISDDEMRGNSPISDATAGANFANAVAVALTVQMSSASTELEFRANMITIEKLN